MTGRHRPDRPIPAERPAEPSDKPSNQQWYEFMRSAEGAPLLGRSKPPLPDQQRRAPADAKVANENQSQIEPQLLTTRPAQAQPSVDPISEQIGKLRNQLTGALTDALNKLANQQVAFQQQLIDRQGEVLGQLVASSAAEGNGPVEQMRAENRALRDDLTALVQDELAKAAADRQVFERELVDGLITFVGDELAKVVAERQVFEQRLIDRQSEVLAKLANPLMAERNMQSKQMRAETRALRDQLKGFIGEQFAKLAKDHDRLIAQRDAASAEPVTKVPAELETALGQIRQETQKLREEITRSVTGPIIDRIAIVAEEHARFRTRLVAVARVVETRFDALEARIHSQLDQVGTATNATPRATATKPAPRAAAKKPAPRAAAKKVAPRAGAKLPVPRAAPGPKRARRPS